MEEEKNASMDCWQPEIWTHHGRFSIRDTAHSPPTKNDGSSPSGLSSYLLWKKAARSTSWKQEGSKSLHWNMFISFFCFILKGASSPFMLCYFLFWLVSPVPDEPPVYLIHVFPLLSAVAAVTFVFGYFLHVFYVLGSASSFHPRLLVLLSLLWYMLVCNESTCSVGALPAHS